MTCEQCYHFGICRYCATVFGTFITQMELPSDNMEEYCKKCKPKAEIIELPMKVSQELHDELTKYCTERVVDEL